MQPAIFSYSSSSTPTDELQFLDQFYKSHRTEFIKWAYKYYSLAPDEAIDIYQDAVIVLFENHQKGKLQELRSTVKTYFYGIAKNMIFVYLKKKNRQKSYVHTFSEAGSAAENIPQSDASDDWTEEAIDIITRMVKRMSEKGQAIMYLYYYEKKSLREITKILGYSSEDVVKTTKMRFKNILKQRVSDEISRQNAA